MARQNLEIFNSARVRDKKEGICFMHLHAVRSWITPHKLQRQLYVVACRLPDT